MSVTGLLLGLFFFLVVWRVAALLLWLVLFVLCLPLALAALVLYPVFGLLLLASRVAGIMARGALELARPALFLPVRLLRGRPRPGRA